MSESQKGSPVVVKRKARARRFSAGMNLFLSVVFFGLLVGLLNFAASRYLGVRWNLSSLRYFELSEKTDNILSEIEGNVRITSVFNQEEVLGDEVKFLLKEYEFAARQHEALKLTLEYVDPDRDLLRVKEISDAQGITEPNFILIEVGERSKVVKSDDLVDYESIMDYNSLTGGNSMVVRKRRIGFRGEQALSSAIYSLTRGANPIVYFLQGHGERKIEEFEARIGFGVIVREMQRDNIEVRPLILTKADGIPEDCHALVIAGPRTQLAQSEIEALQSFLEQNGRLMILADPGLGGGLNPLLESWGVTFDNDIVLARERTVTGRELMVTDYGVHAITQPLNGIFCVFYLPRSVNPLAAPEDGALLAADRPKVTILAGSGHDGWAERNLTETPSHYDETQDRAGPIPIAVAVERGAQSRIDMELQPTRMVVIGDSDFVSNIALENAGGGNADFFMNSINWLLERDTLMAISPKSPLNVRLQMDQRQIKTAYLVIVALIPMVVAMLGILIWVRRGR